MKMWSDENYVKIIDYSKTSEVYEIRYKIHVKSNTLLKTGIAYIIYKYTEDAWRYGNVLQILNHLFQGNNAIDEDLTIYYPISFMDGNELSIKITLLYSDLDNPPPYWEIRSNEIILRK